MTLYKKAVHEVLGAKERDIDIVVTRQSVWETASNHVDLPSNVDLVGHWPFNEGSGMIAYDQSGRGNDGTLENMEEDDWVSGKVGTALELDGDDDGVNCGKDTSLDLTSVGTISAWVKSSRSYPSDTGVQNYRAMVSKAYAGGKATQSYFLDWYGNNSTRALRGALSNGVARNDLTLNNFDFGISWRHIAFVWDGSYLKFYIDGEFAGQVAQTVNCQIYDTELRIGKRPEVRSVWDGLLDEVRIYNRALIASEIKALYLFPSGPTTWSENKII